MPWFEANAERETWGWHWTMNSTDPRQIRPNGQRKIAAHYYPEIGPYDSADDAVLEYQLLLMKLSGIDGVIVDWYGRKDHFDYARLHRHTEALVNHLGRLNMEFAICYEDQTIPKLVAGGKVSASAVVDHAISEIRWMKENWFQQKNYLHLDGLPVMLSFGIDGLTNSQWDQTIDSLGFEIQYFSEHHRRQCAVGAFDWPVPEGVKNTGTFLRESKQWKQLIPVAYPRFNDFYQQARISKNWRRISDDDGRTFRQTLQQALETRAPVIQIATWNDWGEGTVIEPSVEFGDRDLKVIQKLRRKYVAGNFPHTGEDLKLPGRLLALRRSGDPDPNQNQKAREIASLIAAGSTAAAKMELDALDTPETLDSVKGGSQSSQSNSE